MEPLVAANRQAERLARFSGPQNPPILDQARPVPIRPSMNRMNRSPHPAQPFSDATYQLDAGATARRPHAISRKGRQMPGGVSPGYIEVLATKAAAYLTSWGYYRYYQYTWAQCSSVTVRDPM